MAAKSKRVLDENGPRRQLLAQLRCGSFHQGKCCSDWRIALGAMQRSTQLSERNISERLNRPIDIDLPRGIALSSLRAGRAEHILPIQKGREQYLVDHGTTR